MTTKITEIYEDLNFLSDRISNQTRTIALSVLAIAWLFLIGGKDAPVLPSSPNRTLLLLAGAGSLLSLVVDYFQYVFGYFDADNVRKRAEKSKTKTGDYNYDACLYRLRTMLFWVKQIFAIAALVMLGIAVVTGLHPAEVKDKKSIEPTAEIRELNSSNKPQ